MTGHSKSSIHGESILWPDANLETLEAGYEVFTLRIREDAGGAKLIRCVGYVGFQMVGFWDEVIIETAEVHSSHSFITDCERRLKLLPESGSEARTATGNRLLEIVFIDGCKLWVCANQFRCERAS